MAASSTRRYTPGALTEFAAALLHAAGLAADRAEDVAAILVDGDLLGHTTHGISLLRTYLTDIESGAMQTAGAPHVIADHGAAVTWDGNKLPGPWLVLRAMDLATDRARRYGTGTVAIRRSHHIACLAAYLERAADRGLMMLLFSSAPNAATVAPYGGSRGVFSPNPVAAGFPTEGSPVLVDVSTSLTSNNLAMRLREEGKMFPHAWLLDENGEPSNDPSVLFPPRAGTILPLGGIDSGHKGYGLSLIVEALTSGLSGYGRADPKEKGMSASVLVQILDPELFGGLDAFRRQTQWIAEACRASPARPGAGAVRLPGEAGLARREKHLRDGVEIASAVMASLEARADKLGVTVPPAI